jgi:pimeloyl-ACP methyl ester carboxylesterase
MSLDIQYILVHGSFHGPWCWDRLTPYLTGNGGITCVDLGNGDHADHVSRVSTALTGTGITPAILVLHSYAGMLAADAIAISNMKPHRTIFLDAFLPFSGESAFDYLQSIEVNLPVDADNMLMTPKPDMMLDTEGMHHADWLAEQLRPFPAATHAALSRHDAREIPRAAYIRCKRFPLFKQAESRARAAGWPIEFIDAGHDAMVTRPDVLAAIINRLIQ